MNPRRRQVNGVVKAIRKRKKVGRIIFLLICISSITLSCGIKTYPYLAPPEDGGIEEPLEGEKIFSFTNYTENNENYFLGYELYYKFYSADIDDTLFESERELIELTPTYEKVTSLGFKRVYNILDIYGRPLIPVNEELYDQSVSIEIDFRFLTDSIYPEVRIGEATLEIARYVQKAGDVEADIYNFNAANISSEYGDISSSVVASDDDTVYLSMYVFSYGKYEVFNELYSKAAYLGRIIVQTENADF